MSNVRWCWMMLVVILLSEGNMTGQVTANILTRVFPIHYGALLGSSFTLEVGGRQYLITAQHLVKELPASGRIELAREGRLAGYAVKRLPIEPTDADIAVLALDFVLQQTLPVKAAYEGVILSEELFFLGFPYGLALPGARQPSGFPFPWVKRGMVSSFGRIGAVDYVFLDGYNNLGFSGGPIVRSHPPATPTIVGVVSGYRGEDEAILKGGEKTDMVYRANTGIVLGVGISHALAAIARSPIGAKVSADSDR